MPTIISDANGTPTEIGDMVVIFREGVLTIGELIDIDLNQVVTVEYTEYIDEMEVKATKRIFHKSMIKVKEE